jgi:hypothetical protein
VNLQLFFFGLCPQGSKHRMRQQRQRDVAVPTLPATHLILIEAAFALGGLKSNLDFPSPAGDVDQRLAGNLGAGCVDNVVVSQ